MAVTEERLTHLAGCLDRTIGPDARSTMLDMLTAADVSGLATKNDIAVLDIRLDEVEKRINIRIDELEKRMDIKLESLEHRITASTMRAINRHLTFSVTAMSAITGLITLAAR